MHTTYHMIAAALATKKTSVSSSRGCIGNTHFPLVHARNPDAAQKPRDPTSHTTTRGIGSTESYSRRTDDYALHTP